VPPLKLQVAVAEEQVQHLQVLPVLHQPVVQPHHNPVRVPVQLQEQRHLQLVLPVKPRPVQDNPELQPRRLVVVVVVVMLKRVTQVS